MSSLHGHYWTLAPHLLKALRPPPVPLARHFSVRLTDERIGPLTLTGRLSELPGADTLVIVVHGLGGSARSKYIHATARAAIAEGLSCLRLNLRGADRLGHDYYHAGQASDVHAALGAPELAHYRHVLLVGWSIGGHVALRYVQGAVDSRLRAAAILCAPVDLDASATAFDASKTNVYRSYVLGGLKEMYQAVARRQDVPVPLSRALRIRTMREWDDLVVAPRYDFASARDYYRAVSAGPHMASIDVPTLFVATRFDPMIPEATVRPALEHASAALDVRWLRRGGHVGFPGNTDLGQPGPPGLEPQVITWLRSRARC
jgi:uncharacterized protein